MISSKAVSTVNHKQAQIMKSSTENIELSCTVNGAVNLVNIFYSQITGHTWKDHVYIEEIMQRTVTQNNLDNLTSDSKQLLIWTCSV